jgi:hypothetical protein
METSKNAKLCVALPRQNAHLPLMQTPLLSPSRALILTFLEVSFTSLKPQNLLLAFHAS